MAIPETINFRASRAERRRLDSIAKRLDLSLSDLLRQALGLWVALDDDGLIDLLLELRKRGVFVHSGLFAEAAGNYLRHLAASVAHQQLVRSQAEAIGKALAGGALTDAEKLHVEAVRASNARAIAFPAAVEALQRAGCLPADLSSQIDHEGVLRLWAMKQAGKLSQEQFDRELAEMQKFPFGELEEGD